MKPIVAITMGDAAGVGPEIVVKALSLESIWDKCRPLVIGDTGVLLEALKVARTSLRLNSIKDIEEAHFVYGAVDVLDLHNIDLKKLEMGRPQAMVGKASFEYVEKAVELALHGKVAAITTAPISKEALHLAGYGYPGHTEILADLTKSSEYAMMFVAGSLRVILVTIHISLLEACRMIKKNLVYRTIKLGDQTMKRLGIDAPRIAVAGLNPHASEGGLFGFEESREIVPAIEAAKSTGLDVSGPYPPDTVFFRANNREFDLVVSMYHDQGCIPIKLLAFDLGVNITVGLPIVRTSPDHGTAYRRAGLRLGTGNPQSLVEAIRLAVDLANDSRNVP